MTADEQVIDVEGHWIIEFAGWNQPLYVLTSKWKSECVLLYGRDYAFVHRVNERLCISSGLKKIRFGQGRSPENPGYRDLKET